MISIGALYGALALASSIAGQHWDDIGVPDRCVSRPATVFVVGAELDVDHPGNRPVADTNRVTCAIRIARDRVTGRSDLCRVREHEEGHARKLWFPSNAADPVHSLDPHNIMAHDGGDMPVRCMTAFAPYRVRFLRDRGFRCKPKVSVEQFRCTRRTNKAWDEEWIDVI